MATAVNTVKEKKPFSLGKWIKSRKGQQVLICGAFIIIPL